MKRLLSEFIRQINRSFTFVVMDAERLKQFGVKTLKPLSIVLATGGILFLLFLAIQAVLLFTPLRNSLPGVGTEDMRSDARQNELRLQSMADSLALQEAYLNRLRDIILGNVEDATSSFVDSEAPVFEDGTSLAELELPDPSDNWEDHVQPALPIERLNSAPSAQPLSFDVGPSFLSAISFPVLPPVSGLLTRGFDARTSHFAIDIAIEEGSVVRSIGDGYVVLSDWMNDGGQVIAVAHAGGFLSVFKHNSSLLKQVGDRVRDREVIARTGNSGEITSGPHAHFELWHNGLAQDPRAYVMGW
ncbi:MAG: M23 family metallopeptidase [Bacteroidetes bacterium]|nr:M23 family metallopeptidase [Bacteroidota bacterium]